MKYTYITYGIITLLLTQQTIQPSIRPTISYPTYQDSPGYNTPEHDRRFDGITPTLFTPFENVVTGDDSNKNEVGYFWPIKDSDKTLLYPGKARIGNSQYINVVAVDSKSINTAGDSNTSISTGQEDIYHPNPALQKVFDDNFLVPIGTFMKSNDPTIYTLYGQYMSTVFPDPRQVGTTGPDGSVALVSQ